MSELVEKRARVVLDDLHRQGEKVTRTSVKAKVGALLSISAEETEEVVARALEQYGKKGTPAPKGAAPQKPPKAPKRSARECLRGWVREKLAAKASFKIPDIVKEAEKRFGNDTTFLKEYAKDAIRALMYEDVQHVAAESRRAIIGAAHVDPTRLEDAANESSRSVWGRWDTCFEHIGEKHVLVLDMKDQDLAEAEAVRYKSAEQHARWGRFFAALRKGMKRGKKVRDCYTTEQLDELWHEATADESAQGAA